MKNKLTFGPNLRPPAHRPGPAAMESIPPTNLPSPNCRSPESTSQWASPRKDTKPASWTPGVYAPNVPLMMGINRTPMPAASASAAP